MLRLLGILIVAVGGLYPLLLTYRINKQLGRPEGPSGVTLGLWLIHTLTFPMALALTGTALVIPALRTSAVFVGVTLAFWGVSVLCGIAYLVMRRKGAHLKG